MLSAVLVWFKSLRRSSTDRMLTGVAGGLAQRTGVPALVIRAGFVLAAFAGVGIPVYLIAWVLVPTDGGQRLTDGGGLRDLLAVGLVVIAGLMLASQVAGYSTADLVWRSLPWALMLLGVALVLRRRETTAATGSPQGHNDAVVRSPQVRPASAEGSTTATATVPAAVGGPAVSAPVGATGPGRIWRPAFPVVGLLTWCAVLVVCGVVGALVLAGVFEVGPGVLAATALVVFGAGLVVSAFRGKARGLILPALVIAAVLGGLAAVDVRIDNVDGAFNLTVSDAAELPSKLRTSYSESSINLVDLKLNSDRYLRIDQTAGTLEVILPLNVRVELKTHVGAGDGTISRLDRETALLNDPELARKWFETGAPKGGEPVDPALFGADSSWGGGWDWWWSSTPFGSGLDIRDERTINNGGEHTLQLDIDMGVGSVRIVDPHWSTRSMPELKAPTQLCAVGGGERGVVKPCGDIPEARRVALCINDNGYLVDCREDRPATPDYPRTPACSGYFGDEVPCADVDIKPVGAQLTTPETADDESDSPPDTIKMPDRPAPTTPTTTDPSTTGGTP